MSKPKRRRHNLRRIKRESAYSIQEIAELLGVHKNAASRWIKAGLRTIDRQRPLLIHGSDLIAFLSHRQAQRSIKCKLEEFYCFRCRLPRLPRNGAVEITQRNEKILNLRAKCSVCDTPLCKAGSANKKAILQQIYESMTPALQHISGPIAPSVNGDFKRGDYNAPE